MSRGETLDALSPSDVFPHRHLGPRPADVRAMLEILGCESLDALIRDTIPADIVMKAPLDLPEAVGEHALLDELRALASKNVVKRSFIGMGYFDCITPPVIQRNILENPGWYTQYTPYQAEISQGRLEALLNFQTMVSDLTGLPLANASLLDEATAAAEAMSMSIAITRHKKNRFFVAGDCNPQTIAVVETRAKPLGIDLTVGAPSAETIDFEAGDLFGILLAYPTTDGRIEGYEELIARAREAGVIVTMVTDLLALTLLRPPGELGADIAVGNSQRFGVPLGAGGPHAAFMATREDYARKMPGRLVGVSKDAEGRAAFRLAVQTREQHIRRDKATSNICTAQVLLAIMASMYAVYHGPEGLEKIARRVKGLTAVLRRGLRKKGFDVGDAPVFDTLKVILSKEDGRRVLGDAEREGMNLRAYEDGSVGISLDERTTLEDVALLLRLFGAEGDVEALFEPADVEVEEPHRRESAYLTHPVFHRYRSELEMLRYIHRLEGRDLSMTTSMIPLGSCTMKLNATTEMLPVTWPELAAPHPFAPKEQLAGYAELFRNLEDWLKAMTGFAGVSLQPNAGSQGEYTGLLVIRAYHESRGESGRNVCLIPVSAHGTNPASAVMAGFRVVAVQCDDRGNVDVEDLKEKAQARRDELGALMVTYPSTHGVFEKRIREICRIVHEAGGQVYMDGANMNAQVGLTSPALIGADVCHLNLHKTFCIPHGGGGPGMGPIGVAEHLVPFLPGHPFAENGGEHAIGPVSAAPYGSPSILPISWAYIKLMGPDGLTEATKIAIVNANYMAKRLEEHYPVLYTGENGRVAHEFIIDCRPLKQVSVEDIAKRLMDYGFHAPTMSFPVAGTLMIEPTESESKEELDRLCDALIAIREEGRAIDEGRVDPNDNPLKNAPHTAAAITAGSWSHPYTREAAAFPAPWVREHKFWPPVARIDNAYGDRHLVCVCPPVEEYA